MGKNIETRCLHIGQETLPYELERKKIKRLNLRVRRDGTVHVSAPVQMRAPRSLSRLSMGR